MQLKHSQSCCSYSTSYFYYINSHIHLINIASLISFFAFLCFQIEDMISSAISGLFKMKIMNLNVCLYSIINNCWVAQCWQHSSHKTFLFRLIFVESQPLSLPTSQSSWWPNSASDPVPSSCSCCSHTEHIFGTMDCTDCPTRRFGRNRTYVGSLFQVLD